MLGYNSGRKPSGWKALLAAKVENLGLQAELAAARAVNQAESAPPAAEPTSGEEDSGDNDEEDDGDEAQLGWEDEGND